MTSYKWIDQGILFSEVEIIFQRVKISDKNVRLRVQCSITRVEVGNMEKI